MVAYFLALLPSSAFCRTARRHQRLLLVHSGATTHRPERDWPSWTLLHIPVSPVSPQPWTSPNVLSLTRDPEVASSDQAVARWVVFDEEAFDHWRGCQRLPWAVHPSPD
ncbi:hypothetical protein B0T16DRAFT_414810 [Cercophora newfieldiana]|uniref:Uncharacterized protein n=1 Tax=Cercophora newfieldiana TaxID=92897 RepID=A0AA40CQB0_9PEZI|nr:hypothetical protein B0T16DRAFT_414810 [Cercophora newfieldiana]